MEEIKYIDKIKPRALRWEYTGFIFLVKISIFVGRWFHSPDQREGCGAKMQALLLPKSLYTTAKNRYSKSRFPRLPSASPQGVSVQADSIFQIPYFGE